MNAAKILVTAKEAADMLSMGQSTFWRKVHQGALPQAVKVAGMTRWRVSDLQQCVEPQANRPTTALAHASA